MRGHVSRLAGWTSALAAIAMGAAAQQPPFRSGVNLVRVDVIVSDDDGLPVGDLTAADFEIREDGRQQTIDTFKLVDVDPGYFSSDGPPPAIRTEADEEREAGRDEVRLFAIFLDDYHVRWENAVRAREEVARFVELHVGPNDLLLVMDPHMPIAAARFTRERAPAIQRIRQFAGRQGRYEARTAFEREYACHGPATIEAVRSQVSASALHALIIRMGFLKEGRKALILLSEGLVPRDSSSVRPCNSFGSGGTRDAVWSLELRDLYETANQNNVAIYPVDAQGVTTTRGAAAGREALRALAVETDGATIFNRGEITRAMQRIVRDSSAYYLLGYSSSAPADGRFHDIDVHVKRRGVRVRARKGYQSIR